MMDEHKDMHDHPHHHGLLKSRLVMKLFAAFLIVATIFVGAKAVNAIINFDTLSEPPSNVITVMGEGKVSAVPDIATISFTISEDADTSSHAQDGVAKKVNVALALLKDLKVADKDIQTSSYNISPRYSQPAPCYTGVPCPYNQESKIIGFTASETVEVTVRKIDDTGKVLSVLGDAGVTNLYGPNFSVDDPDALKAEARKEAIDKARAQAKGLAGDLGVRLVRVVNYSENGGSPIYYAKDMAVSASATAPRPEISVPTGENEIVVNVSVTYEIR
ncbi:MAG: SIMPL domain-containing protein [Patescibacteria group bacterium]